MKQISKYIVLLIGSLIFMPLEVLGCYTIYTLNTQGPSFNIFISVIVFLFCAALAFAYRDFFKGQFKRIFKVKKGNIINLTEGKKVKQGIILACDAFLCKVKVGKEVKLLEYNELH